MQVATIGLDTSKHVFQVHGVDAKGRLVCRRKLRRTQLAAYFANLPCCLIGLEACGGAHYWARRLSRLGHTVRLMAPQFVKPYVKSNKNDANDAEAICEAVSRPTMRFVPTKCVAQQDWQMLHRVRSRLIGTRTQLSNQIRGLLAEYGIIIPSSVSNQCGVEVSAAPRSQRVLSSCGRRPFLMPSMAGSRLARAQYLVLLTRRISLHSTVTPWETKAKGCPVSQSITSLKLGGFFGSALAPKIRLCVRPSTPSSTAPDKLQFVSLTRARFAPRRSQTPERSDPCRSMMKFLLSSIFSASCDLSP